MQHLKSELVLAVHRLLRTPPEVVPNHLNVVASRLWLWYVCPYVRMFGERALQHWFSDDVLVI